MKDQEKILIFNVNWLGDVLFSTATIRNVRSNYPDAFIACIIPPRALPVLEGNIYLDEVIIFDEEHKHKNPWQKLQFVNYLRKKKFDKVYLLHRSMSRALIAWMAGIPERVGYYTSKRGFLLTKPLTAPDPESVHRIDYYLNIIKDAGLTVSDRHTDFFVKQEDIKAVEEFLVKNSISEDDFIAGLNPGGNWGPKRWPLENFAELADKLAEELKAKIIITGSEKDIELAEEIRQDMHHGAVLACGKLTIKQFAVLANILNIFVSADSGPMHIANAVGSKKIFALFGPTDPKLTGPYPPGNVVIIKKNLSCRIPCYKVECSDNLCMKEITPEDVMAEIRKSFKQRNGKFA
jgi:lipopolysaccharide heptosyltransferase II